LCGWLGGWALWLGAISDTEYFEKMWYSWIPEEIHWATWLIYWREESPTHQYSQQGLPQHPCSMVHWWTATASTFLCKKWPKVLE
jgi:hypothetical protein